MEFQVGAVLLVDNVKYDVIGKVEYRNRGDNCCWFEYRMISRNSRKEKWLSVDEIYKEYSISEVTRKISYDGYHMVDSGTEEVVRVWGDVDVDVGDQAEFKEYEDSTEEKIISSEIWDDGEELSCGYYVDEEEIQFCSYEGGRSLESGSNSGTKMFRNRNNLILGIWIILIGCYYLSELFPKQHSIEKYLKQSSLYEYETSITGNQKQKADVYHSCLDLDTTAKDILQGIEGDTIDVQQNTEEEDKSIAILTKKEYCLIYVAEDEQILIQISSRKYAYTTDDDPYHASAHTRRYYRRYYYSRGYNSDASSYGNSYSPYVNYDDTYLGGNDFDPYSSYASSVRQSSIDARSSSGGGLSSGK